MFAAASLLAATSWTLSTGLGGRYLWRFRNPPQAAPEDSARS
jgi:hypothetical protein